MLAGIRKELAKVKTEVGERNAVVRALKKRGHKRAPEVTQGKTEDRRVVRMYLWRDTPMGNLCLVTGPSVEGELHELHPHYGGERGAVYFPASKGRPALSELKQPKRTRQEFDFESYVADRWPDAASELDAFSKRIEAKLQENPQARVGKVRTDKKTGKKYVLWRPVLKDGSRPRIYLDADKPQDAELVDITEAKEQLDASKRVVERKEADARKKGLRGIWKFGTGRKIFAAKPKAKPMLRASSATPLFDSEGKEYRATYAVIATESDGMGPVLASNLPESFVETPDYPTVFQARSLQRLGETQKIRKIAKDLDPDRLLLPHSDATLGAPVVWQGDGKKHRIGDTEIVTHKDRFYVLGGNGRTIALLMAPSSRYQAYVQRGKSLWPDIWPKGGSPDGTRNILVRTVSKPDGSALTFAQARTLAGRTQKSASGEESPIGRALSLIRSLGIERVSDLPTFQWKGIITQDNVDDFTSANAAFTNAVFGAMGDARAESYQQDPALLADMFNDLLVGYLPRRFQLSGFVSEKQERALLAALPIILSIHTEVESGNIQDKWDLFPLLDPALRFAQFIKNQSDVQAIRMVEAAASQVQLGEGTALSAKFKSLFDELPLLAVMFGIVLKKAEKGRDPAITIEQYLGPYADEAFASPSAKSVGMFGGGAPDPGKDPVQVLASELRISLPRRARDAQAPQVQLIANPSVVPPANVARAARAALELRASMPRSKRAGTKVGLARANQLASRRPVSPDTLKRMVSFFARHDGARERAARLRDHKSKAAQAWGLWGGDPGRAWATRELKPKRNRKGQLRVGRAASRILERLYLRGTTGYAANAKGDFPPGVDELQDKGLAERVTCIPGSQTLYGTDTCTLRLTKRGRAFAKNRRRAERTHAAARQERMFNPRQLGLISYGEQVPGPSKTLLRRVLRDGQVLVPSNPLGGVPPELQELLDRNMVEVVRFEPASETLFNRDARTVILTRVGRTYLSSIAGEDEQQTDLAQGRLFNPQPRPAIFRTLAAARQAASDAGVRAKSDWDFRQSYALDARDLGEAKGWAIRKVEPPSYEAEILTTDGTWTRKIPKKPTIQRRHQPETEQIGFGELLQLPRPELLGPTGETGARTGQQSLLDPSQSMMLFARRKNEGKWEGHVPGADTPGPPGTQLGLFGGVYGGRPDENPDTAPSGRLTIFNMGLGRDSITMLCLLAKGELLAEGKKLGPEDVDAVVFSDTGNEWKHTYDLIPRVEAFAQKHGIRFIQLKKPRAGTESGKLMEDWLAAMSAARQERESGWWDVYKNTVQPRYQELAKHHDELRARKAQDVKDTRKHLKGLNYTTDQINDELKKIRARYDAQIKDEKKEAKAWAAALKKEGGFAGKAERAWWAPKDPERREMFDTIEARADAGLYHLRPELLTDFAWKGTIPLRSDKSCTGNHKVAPIRKVTEDLAIEKFGPWATNTAWGREVGAGSRLPHLNLIGLAADETDRLAKGGDIGCFNVRYVTEAYPLAEMGIAKDDEQAFLDECGFGDTRKSGCWSCPFQPIGWWWALSVLHPDKFQRAVEAEDTATQRDPKLFYTGAKKEGQSLFLPEAVAEWRRKHPDADPAEVLDKQYAKCAVKFAEPKKNPELVDSCCPECNRFVDKWLQFGIPEWLDRVQTNPVGHMAHIVAVHRNPSLVQMAHVAMDAGYLHDPSGASAQEIRAAYRLAKGPPGTYESWDHYYTVKLRNLDRAIRLTRELINEIGPERASVAGGADAQLASHLRTKQKILREMDELGLKKKLIRNRAPTQLQLELLGSIPVLHFASGSNHPGEIRGFADIGKAVGAAYGGTSKSGGAHRWSRLCRQECIDGLAGAAAQGIPVFLDSGAFSEVELQDGEMVKVAPISHQDWLDRLDVYSELADKAGELANVVAPDRVGDQEESFQRLERYAPQVRQLIAKGATVLVPLQKGELTLAQAHRRAQDILGAGGWVPALPFKKAATTPSELKAYLQEIRPARVHLLGVGPRSANATKIAQAVREGSPETDIQMDSVALTAHTGRGKSPRRVTAAQDVARDRLKIERQTGYTALMYPDWTELIGFPSEWATKSALRRIGSSVGLDRKQTAQLLRDPDGYFQSGDPPFYLRAEDAIESELARHLHKTETYEVKRAGAREGLRELYGSPAYIRNKGSKGPRYFEKMGPMGAPQPGERGYKPQAELGRAYGGRRPYEIATRMLQAAQSMLGTDELFWAYCLELPEDCDISIAGLDALEQEHRELDLPFLADLLDAPTIGGDGEPLHREDRAAIALSAVKLAVEGDPERWEGRELVVGQSKSRKGGSQQSKTIVTMGGNAPDWALRTVLTDYLAEMIPGYKQELRVVNVDKDTATKFIEQHHSALPYLNARGLIFALGVMKGDRLVAVATANTPSGRGWMSTARTQRGELDPQNILELTRVASDGTVKGAASKLVSRLIDVMDRSKRGDPEAPSLLVTYQLNEEKGTTYKALKDKGLRPVARVPGKPPGGARSGGDFRGDPALARREKIRWECCVEPTALRADWKLVREQQVPLLNRGVSRLYTGRELVSQKQNGDRPPTEIQSLMFDKSGFTPKQATKWAKRHGFSAPKIHETANLYRVRVSAPSGFDPEGLRTITLDKGIKAVVGPPRR